MSAPTVTTEAESEKPVTLFEVFSNRNFLYLWLGQVLAYLGDRVAQMAMVAIATAGVVSFAERTDKQNDISIIGNIPFLLITPFIGALIDRYSKRSLLMVMDGIRVILIFGAAWLFAAGAKNGGTAAAAASHPYLIYGLVFAIYSATSVFLPAKSAFLTEIVPPSHLLRANSVTATMGSLTTLLGTIVGVQMVAWVGAPMTLAVNGLGYLASFLLLFLIKPPVRHERPVAAKTDFLDDLMHGVRATHRNAVAFASVAMNGWVWGIVGAFFALLVAVINQSLAEALGLKDMEKEILPLQGKVFGLLGASLFVGGVVAGRLGNRISLATIVGTGFIGSGLCMIVMGIPAFGVTKALVPACVVISLMGMFGGAVVIPLETAIGKAVDEEYRGRVFAFNTFVLQLTLVICMLIASKFVTRFPEQLSSALLVTGIIGILGVFLVTLLPAGTRLSDMAPLPEQDD